jgi:hypothetical protein
MFCDLISCSHTCAVTAMPSTIRPSPELNWCCYCVLECPEL